MESGTDFVFSDWANLPEHLLDLVFERLLLPSDCDQFSAVCMSWHSVAKENQSQRAMVTAPMLLFSNKNTWSLYDVMNDKVLNLQLRLPKKRFCGSSKGWLIVVDENFVVSLINPLFRVNGRKERENSIIRLPPLNPPRHYNKGRWSKNSDYFVIKATISADPISNANDCVVMVIHESSCELAFIRLSKDKKWTYVDTKGDKRWCFYEDVAQIGDKIYVVNSYWSTLFAFDCKTQIISNVEVIARGFKPEECMNKIYLVGSNEKDLLMVHRYIGYQTQRRATKGFKIFEFNSAKCEWIEIYDLGDVALFVGDNSSICVRASNTSGCESNCIYFYNDYDRGRKDYSFPDFGVYNVKSRRISKPAHVKTLVKKMKQPPIWFLPSS